MFALGIFVLAEAPVAEHQVVVRLQIFGVDGERIFENPDCVGVATLEEHDAADLIDYYAVARVLAAGFGQAR